MQWDTSDHDWLEGRGEKLYLIAMIDDATSRLFARFVGSDSTEENMKLLWRGCQDDISTLLKDHILTLLPHVIRGDSWWRGRESPVSPEYNTGEHPRR